jgi:hypothetical protein
MTKAEKIEFLQWYVPLLLKSDEFKELTKSKEWSVDVYHFNPPAPTAIRVVVNFPQWFDDAPFRDAHGCFMFDEHETFWQDHVLFLDILKMRLHDCLDDIHRLRPVEAA